MSYKPNEMMEINVEIVDNLLESFEYIISSINFWQYENKYPFNLICKVCADCLYVVSSARKTHVEKKLSKHKSKKKAT